MPTISKISAELEGEILAQAARGMSSRAIAEWLETERGVHISNVAIAKRLAQTRVERGDVAKAVTREALRPIILSDLEVLQEQRDRLVRMSGDLYGVDHEVFLKTQDRLTKVIETRMKFAGVDGQDEVEHMSDDKLRELAAKAMRVLAGDK